MIQIDNDDAVPLAKVLLKYLLGAEITFRTAAAAESIRPREEFPEIVLCAGTVLTKEQVDAAIEAGADFVISPGFNQIVGR